MKPCAEGGFTQARTEVTSADPSSTETQQIKVDIIDASWPKLLAIQLDRVRKYQLRIHERLELKATPLRSARFSVICRQPFILRLLSLHPTNDSDNRRSLSHPFFRQYSYAVRTHKYF